MIIIAVIILLYIIYTGIGEIVYSIRGLQIKIVNFTEDTYKIKYRTFLFWYNLKGEDTWNHIFYNKAWSSSEGILSDRCSTKIFFRFKEAKDMAEQFNTIEDIRLYHRVLKDSSNRMIKHRKQLRIQKKINFKIK